MPKLLILGLLLSAPVLVRCGGSDSADSASPARAGSSAPQNSQGVPPELTHLIPMAQEWGIGDDVARLAKVDGATPAQRAELRQAVGPHQQRITGWLNSFGQGGMSDEAASFMYMQLAIEEMINLP